MIRGWSPNRPTQSLEHPGIFFMTCWFCTGNLHLRHSWRFGVEHHRYQKPFSGDMAFFEWCFLSAPLWSICEAARLCHSQFVREPSFLFRQGTPCVFSRQKKQMHGTTWNNWCMIKEVTLIKTIQKTRKNIQIEKEQNYERWNQSQSRWTSLEPWHSMT